MTSDGKPCPVENNDVIIQAIEEGIKQANLASSRGIAAESQQY